MIRIIQGAPGSGKSYYMMKYLSNFFKFDSFYDEFILKDDVLVIANIEGLKVKHLNLNDQVQKYGLEGFFSVANFEKIQEIFKVKNIVLLIDEAQNFFDRKYYNKEVFYFFQYHRHLGVDIILGTQAANLLANSFIPLCEYIVHAVPRSKSIIGNFSYHFKDQGGKFLYSKVLKKDQTIFKAYKSFNSDEISKPKNVLFHWFVFVVILLSLGGLCFKTALATVKAKSKVAPKVPGIVNISNTAIPPQATSLQPPVPLPSPQASIQTIAVQNQMSSVRQPLIPITTNNVHAASDLPRVVGVVKSGSENKYLLSTGLIVGSRRSIALGEVYIR